MQGCKSQVDSMVSRKFEAGAMISTMHWVGCGNIDSVIAWVHPSDDSMTAVMLQP